MKDWMKDRMIVNVLWLAFLTVVESLQLLIIVVLCYSFIPIKLASITEGVVPQLLQFFKPEREILFYRIFIATAVLGQGVLLSIFAQQLKNDKLTEKLRSLSVIDGLWVALQLLFVFRITQYGDPAWARLALYVTIGLSMLSRIFWPELRKFLEHLPSLRFTSWKIACGLYALAIISVTLVLYIPDIDLAVARIFAIDRFAQFDWWLMAPLWANQANWHGGAVLLLKSLSSMLGGVSYAHVLKAAVLISIAYYIALFTLVRYWLGSFAISFIAVFLAIKLQIFAWGVEPLVWSNLAHTPLAHVLDVAVLFCLLKCARSSSWFFGLAAAFIVGLSLFYNLKSGLALTVAFEAFALTSFYAGYLPLKQGRQLWVALLIPWAVAFVLYALASCLSLNAQPLNEAFADLALAWQGLGALPMVDCLRSRQFFAFTWSLLLPVFIVLSLCVSVALGYIKRYTKDNVLVPALACYSLVTYAIFIWHSSINDYYALPTGMVLLACFWFKELLVLFKEIDRQRIKIAAVFTTAVVLATNILFAYYPNIFNLSQQQGVEEKAFYRSKTDLDAQAQLISRLIPQGASAALIAAREVEILMKANRRPFFCYFPLLKPFDASAGQLGVMTLNTKAQLLRVIGQLQDDQPRYIFIDANVLGAQEVYAKQGAQGMAMLLDFITRNYVPSQMSAGNLVVLILKDKS